MPDDRSDLEDLIGGWPVGQVAVAVVAADGTVTSAGAADRRFGLASVSKPLAALAVLVAVEEGTVSLDDHAGPPGSTLRHLLAHASGLAFDGEVVLAPPGTRRIYSNTGIETAAAHLARRSGLPFEVYLREAVFEPLAMSSTELVGSPAHGVSSTLADMAAVAAELMDPTILDPSTLAQATTAHYPDLVGVLPEIGRFDPNPWGLGVEIRGRKRPHWTGTSNSPSTFGHFGGSGTFLWVDPEAGCAAVALTDTRFGPWALEHWPAFSDAVLCLRR